MITSFNLGVEFSAVVDTPRHSGLGDTLSYRAPHPIEAGCFVRVPLGKRETLGIAWEPQCSDQSSTSTSTSTSTSAGAVVLRDVLECWDLPPLSDRWRALVRFAAAYYQRGLGELALGALPPELRNLDATQLARRLKRLRATRGGAAVASPSERKFEPRPELLPEPLPELNASQAQVLATLQDAAPKAHLLWGLTGSGKTEIYLREADRVLDAGGQVLMMVPEINLTPQLLARVQARFPNRCIVDLHSALTPAQRLKHWLLAHLGEADLILGTRMAVFASMPRLGLIVVDEEHDPSYKQQEGARYSARDLAVMRGRLEGAPVLLGSATPSLETWFNAQPAASESSAIDVISTSQGTGRYGRLVLDARIGGGALPQVKVMDWGRLQAQCGKPAVHAMGALSTHVVAALNDRVERGEQSLVLLNRRGYAPVLHCAECGWKSGCPHCSAWRVFHKGDRTLRCHHCGFTERVPRACPDCGNQDIEPLGRGTERLEEQLAHLLPTARVGRIDADTTRNKGELASQLASVHAGEVDIVVGTQMVAKGHDFRRMTLVAAINPDAALFSSDFRAPERLFALLMQAAGRAGRDAALAGRSEMIIQTWHPAHPLYQALKAHDYTRFAQAQLDERRQAGLPPFVHLALLRAEAREQAQAQAFLDAAAAVLSAMPGGADVLVYPPIPAPVQRVANVERAQMLVEAVARGALQQALGAWLPQLHALKSAHKGVLRWAVDVDPMAI